MNILVLGASGMAGHTITLYFKEAGHNVYGYSRKVFDFCSHISGDVTDFDRVKKIILTGNFDAVINAVGLLNEDAEKNRSKAILINTYLPHFLNEITTSLETKILHMSTDCVFSGKQGNYKEHSLRDGLTFYDRTKALGELENSKDLTFRNSIIGPDINASGIGLFNWFMQQENSIDGYVNAIWTGVTTLTLAKAMEKALYEGLTGIYHLVNNETITKYELLILFNDIMNKQIEVVPFNNKYINKSLVNTRTDFSFKVPSYNQMIIEMKEWIYDHKFLYKHYFE